MLADFLTNTIEQIPFPKTADGAVGQFMLVSRDAWLPFQGIQQTNVSGEQVSFCLTISIINHLDFFTKLPYYNVSKIHNKCCKVVNMID